ncbi:glycine receptor subunit alpha-2-like [Mytilus galloprovincialis]|uniref:glycine receptor subunit alpha-2-like n=1 Tax=Mytilus galloprovincialis TaxID=29158 RepID=UPI003F7B5F9A
MRLSSELLFSPKDFPIASCPMDLYKYPMDEQTCSLYLQSSSFSCIQLNLHFERDIGYYMIQFFVPSMMIVLLYWVSFWLTIDAVPARISLGILTILTMTTQRSAGTASLPRVSYIKAIDVWMGACLVFVFAALLEFAFVNVMERRQIRRVQSVRLKGNGESKPCLYN